MPPLSLLIKPASGACNYRCRYCFYADVMRHRQQPGAGMMSLATLESLVRRAMAYGEGSVNFGFQGGEPTLAGLNFYRALIRFEQKYASGARVTHSIQTNGALIDEEWASFLAENHFLVGLSMDGAREAHNAFRMDLSGNGTYEQTLRAARLLQASGAQFNILCVVNALVAARPEETYEALCEYQYLQFIPCIDDFDLRAPRFSPSAEAYGNFLIKTFDLYRRDILRGDYVSVRAFDNYVQMLRGKRPESCNMNGRCACYFVIEGNGNVYPCDFYVLDEWKIGNVNEDSFAAMHRSARAQAFVNSSVYVDPRCRACKHYSLCRGGCRRDREPFDENGRPALNRYCEGFRAFFDASGAALREIARML